MEPDYWGGQWPLLPTPLLASVIIGETSFSKMCLGRGNCSATPVYLNITPTYSMSTSDGIWISCWSSGGNIYWHNLILHYDSTCVNLCTNLLE